MNPALDPLMSWLWLAVIRPSWLSLALAPVVLTGYWLLGRGRREGWWFVMASNAGLLAIGLTNRQYGLAVVLVLMGQAFRNWRRWGRPGALA
jgi:hypothetical protein